MSHTVSKGGLRATVGDQLITDLDYADDVALLAEMLEVLLTSLDIMQSKASNFGLEINWAKIQSKKAKSLKAVITPAGNEVEVVDNFIYLGCSI